MDDDGSSIVSRDLLWLFNIGLVALIILLITFINPEAEESTDELDPQGNIVIRMTWDDEADVDLDLWALAPGEMPVGYSNKGGRTLNLLRDDLGHVNDPANENAEIIIGRALPDGEWVVNIHVYRAGPLPLEAYVDVMTGEQRLTSIASDTVILEHEGEEMTVFRFTLKDGEFVKDSLNHVPIKLRTREVPLP